VALLLPSFLFSLFLFLFFSFSLFFFLFDYLFVSFVIILDLGLLAFLQWMLQLPPVVG